MSSASQRLLERRLSVPLVHLVEVDVIGTQPAQAGLAAGDEVVAGEPGVVRPAPIGIRTLVATSTWSRAAFRASPRISSASPSE